MVSEPKHPVATAMPVIQDRSNVHDREMMAERRDEGTISLAELKKRVM
jgi:hypothetical protein